LAPVHNSVGGVFCWGTTMKELLSVPNEECASYCEGANASIEPHSCPLLAELFEDEFTLCICCKDCEEECAQNI